jgi:hypothetical protein
MKGKYPLLCISVVFIVGIAMITSPEYEEEKGIIGLVFDIHKTEKGFTFSFEDTNGSNMRCFSYNEPLNNEIYIIKGNFSSDGNMFFIKEMKLLE